jgi:hypothetical protein
MATFDELTLKDAEERIPDRGEDWLKANRAYYHGDHWQDGDGWSGPMLDMKHKLYSQMLLEIQRAFVSKNTIAEVAERHSAGVIGREPRWRLTVRRPLADGEEPTAQEQTLIDEAEMLLNGWWEDRGCHKVLREAAETMLLAKRGSLRLFVPPGLLVDGLVPREPVEEAIGRIYLHHPEPEQAAVPRDRNTMQDIGIYLFERNNQKLAELIYLDGDWTVIRLAEATSDEGEEEEQPEPWRFNLGGRLTMFEMNRRLLITEQVRQNQKLLNLALTMLQRNVIQGGFLERTFFNAQLPGKDIPDPDRPGETKFVPEPLHVGPGATNFLSGVVTEDDQGNTVVATPSVVYRNPVPVETFAETKREAYSCILEEVDQLHVLITGDATASGESRKQAQTDFRQSLLDSKDQLEKATAWLLETVLAMAAEFSGQAGRYEELRVDAECRVDLGPISGDEQRVARELVEAQIISKRTAMSRVGVDDADAEAGQIATEQEESSQRQQQSLATAVLNAQRQLAGGQQSTGLEQPEGEEE